jgi:hypothetical protein
MLQVIHCDFVPKKMEECILEHATMTVPKKSVSIDPSGILVQIAQEIGTDRGPLYGPWNDIEVFELGHSCRALQRIIFRRSVRPTRILPSKSSNVEKV